MDVSSHSTALLVSIDQEFDDLTALVFSRICFIEIYSHFKYGKPYRDVVDALAESERKRHVSSLTPLDGMGEARSCRWWQLPAFCDGISFGKTAGLEVCGPYRDGAIHFHVYLQFDGEEDDKLRLVDICVDSWVVANDTSSPEDIISMVRTACESCEINIKGFDEEPPYGAYHLLGDQIIGLQEITDSLCEQLENHENGVAMRAVQADLAQARRDTKRRDDHILQLGQTIDAKDARATRAMARADALEKELRDLKMEKPESSGQGSVLDLSPLMAAAESERQALQALVSSLETRLQQQEDVNDQLRRSLYNLRSSAANEIESLAPPAGQDFPISFKGLGAWAKQALNERVAVLPRALSAARKSDFANPSLAYRTLRALADHYWPMKFEDDAEARSRWQHFLLSERLECGPTGAAVQDRRTTDTYHVDWQRRRVPLDMHIQGNSSRDPTQCFRLYFYVDEKTSVLVVGHLPSHLPSTYH